MNTTANFSHAGSIAPDPISGGAFYQNMEVKANMKKYKITIAEARTYKQFVCEISAESEQGAKERAKKDFSLQFPEYMFHFKIIMCDEILF